MESNMKTDVKMELINDKIRLPEYELTQIGEKKNKYLICIPVLNEGEKFKNQLAQMQKLKVSTVADLIICDGGSTDGSADIEMLAQYDVTALVIRKSKGHLSDQLMLGYYYALVNGYEGTITIDGNGKDGIEGIFKMARALDKGFDFAQGSRYRNPLVVSVYLQPERMLMIGTCISLMAISLDLGVLKIGRAHV